MSDSAPYCREVGFHQGVTDDLKRVLLQFTTACLVEEPEDIIDFAVDFFKELQKCRPEKEDVDSDVLAIDSIISMEQSASAIQFGMRRQSVFAEAIDPTDEDDMDIEVFPKTDEQRARLLTAVKNVLVFRGLHDEERGKLMDAMFERSVTKDEFIIREGEDGDYFYVIESGVFNVFKEGDFVYTYRDRGIFGELALMYNQPRSATIVAESDGLLWALGRKTFRRIVLHAAYQQRATYESLIANVPMLKMLTDYEQTLLADCLVTKNYVHGQIICKQGEKPDGMYFVQEGVVHIRRQKDDQEYDVSKIFKGGYFGEVSLLAHQPRLASAYAEGEVKLAFLEEDAFDRVLGPITDILEGNIELYERRWRTLRGSE